MNVAKLLMIDLSGPSLTPDEREFLRAARPGGVCLFARNVVDRVQVGEYVAELRSLAGEELLVAVDQEGGGVVRIPDIPYPPGAMALGAADDVELTEAVAAATGRGLAALGINVDFAPVADVNSNPANPVIADRSFGADPQHVARHVVAFVRGLQGAGVAATVKHFPGHGDVAIDSHLDLPRLERNEELLESLELPPFRAAIYSGAAAVMSAHIVLPQLDELPATLSAVVLEEILRRRLGFEGVVFSDSLDMKAIADRWTAPEAAVLALAAGVDMPVFVGPVREHAAVVAGIEAALGQGRLSSERLAAAIRRLQQLAADFPPRPGIDSAWLESDERLLAEAARRSLVAIGKLPRLESGSRVLLVAAGAVRQGAATQSMVRPSLALERALRERGVQVEAIEYDPYDAGTVLPVATAAASSHDLLLFASTGRTALTASEIELGRSLAAAARRFLHLALWYPYAVAEIPGPALVTFGWRERSAAAAAAALTGAPVIGIPPVPLRTFDDLEP